MPGGLYMFTILVIIFNLSVNISGESSNIYFEVENNRRNGDEVSFIKMEGLTRGIENYECFKKDKQNICKKKDSKFSAKTKDCKFCYKKQKQLSDRSILECYERERNGLCTREYDPVCGTDGRTYSNKCNLCFQKYQKDMTLTIAKEGSC